MQCYTGNDLCRTQMRRDTSTCIGMLRVRNADDAEPPEPFSGVATAVIFAASSSQAKLDLAYAKSLESMNVKYNVRLPYSIPSV